MEAFTLLKYWKGGGISGIGGGYSDGADTRGGISNATKTTMVDDNSDRCGGDGDDDDGGFFDLEFPEDGVVVLEEKGSLESGEEVVLCCSEETVEGDDEILSLSSSENGSEVVVTVGSEGKTPPLLMKPAAKLKFLISGLKKLPALPPLPALQLQQRKQKPPRETDTNQEKVKDNNNNNTVKKKIFAVKFNVYEVPFMSLFTKDTNGSRSGADVVVTEEKVSNTLTDTTTTTSEEEVEEVDNGNNYNKDVMRKYLSKIKPLYIRVSKKYSDKVPVVSSEQSIDSSDDTKTNQEPEEKSEPAKQPALPPKLVKVDAKGKGLVRKQFGKSKSASSMVHSIPVQGGKRDDSLLQQEDGIQSAILHCKNSFNVSTTIVEAKTGTTLPPLWRSVSDPCSHQKSTAAGKKLEDQNHVVVMDS
ncbi:putative membrane-associated kinase regulator 2 [Drosera capensis]